MGHLLHAYGQNDNKPKARVERFPLMSPKPILITIVVLFLCIECSEDEKARSWVKRGDRLLSWVISRDYRPATECESLDLPQHICEFLVAIKQAHILRRDTSSDRLHTKCLYETWLSPRTAQRLYISESLLGSL